MHSSLRFVLGLGALIVLAVGSTVVAGPDWVEEGDAGSDLNTAQPVEGTSGGPVQRIFGNLNSSTAGLNDFEDVYQIFISDPTNLLITTVGTSTEFQSSLWLFDSDGFALLGNQLAPSFALGGEFGPIGAELGNMSTDGTEIVINTPGIYYIAITGVPRVPFGGGGPGVISDEEPMFHFGSPYEVSGPDGEGGNQPLQGWVGQGATGAYEIKLTGVSFIPAPGALSLLALGALGARRRRRSS